MQESSVYSMIKVRYVRPDLKPLREEEVIVLLPSLEHIDCSAFKIKLLMTRVRDMGCNTVENIFFFAAAFSWGKRGGEKGNEGL